MNNKIFLVEVLQKTSVPDPIGHAVLKDIQDVPITGIKAVRVGFLFRLSGYVSHRDIEKIASKLLTDPITQEFYIREHDQPLLSKEHERRVEVWFHPSVTDTVSETVKIGICDLGITGIKQASTGTVYIFNAVSLSDQTLKYIAAKILANGLIHCCTFY